MGFQMQTKLDLIDVGILCHRCVRQQPNAQRAAWQWLFKQTFSRLISISECTMSLMSSPAPGHGCGT